MFRSLSFSREKTKGETKVNLKMTFGQVEMRQPSSSLAFLKLTSFVSIGVKFALEKYPLHEKKRYLRSTSLRPQPTMEAKLILAFLHFALSNFHHAYLRSAKEG